MPTMTHNATHLLLVTIFTVILSSCLCSIDQDTQKQDEKAQLLLSHLTSESEGGPSSFENEKRASAFMPGRGRKSIFESSPYTSSLIDGDSNKRSPSSAFYGARGKKLILYPFFDYTWKRAHMIPMRGRKDSPLVSLDSLVRQTSGGVSGGAGNALAASSPLQLADESGWKRSLFYGSRGKKDSQAAAFGLPDDQIRVSESGYASLPWPEINAIDDEKRAGFYGSRG